MHSGHCRCTRPCRDLDSNSRMGLVDVVVPDILEYVNRAEKPGYSREARHLILSCRSNWDKDPWVLGRS